MNVVDQSNLSSSIKLIKELEDLAVSKARAVFGPQYPNAHAYEVVVSKTRNETGDEYEARLIVYTGAMAQESFAEWKILLANPCLCESPVDAMADLLEGLYERAGEVLRGMAEGETYNGQSPIRASRGAS